MIPAITSKLYFSIVNEMVKLPMGDPERHRLGVLQRQLAKAQVTLGATKGLLDTWLKAG